MDKISKSQRSYTMSCIGSKNTKPELLLRSALFKKGYRFRLHLKVLPGKPDIVLPKYKTVIFVNGCFWHMHKRCRKKLLPTSNTDYWHPKLIKNVKRDLTNKKSLIKLGWNVIVVWECEIRKKLEGTLCKIETNLIYCCARVGLTHQHDNE